MQHFKTKPVGVKKASLGLMTEDQLGWNIHDACKQLGWQFYWLRKTQHGSKGILDLLLVSTRLHQERDLNGNRTIMFRELKGYDARGRLGTLTPEQTFSIQAISAAGGNAALWIPEMWYSGQILEELR